MAYDKFDVLNSTAVPLPIENIDTDQIIPARFLKATERIGFGDNLFRDWRYNSDNSPKEDFVLNNGTYSGKILLGGKSPLRALHYQNIYRLPPLPPTPGSRRSAVRG